ncbi:hypothetical protein LVJ82_18035 [Vitreoscilla massiliensis]|uniref:Uncharacterized protein n=1 Tax=Vitreoscilla massiliensis TaxID=1689272 RepID=A0ABY4E1U2_9NEIS|nr:hypothetical protein [Vitreoscilla massiliensis]UOO89316.1 hypothetical protein LVJ82_18035 [Vitreoscilla massiliensis]
MGVLNVGDFFFGRWFWMPLAVCVSLLLYQTGKRALERAHIDDERVLNIPDRDVRQLWQDVSALNDLIGWFYTRVAGPYFLVFSVWNMVTLCFLAWDIPVVFDRSAWSLLWVTVLMVGLCLSNQGRIYHGDGYWSGFIGLDMRAFTNTLFALYESIGFQSRHTHGLTKMQSKNMAYIGHLLKLPPLLKCGMFVWYGAWMVWVLVATLRIAWFNL